MRKRKKRELTGIIIVSGLVVLVVAFLSIYLIRSLRPRFTLSVSQITVEAGQQFFPQDLIASVENADVSEIVIDGTVSVNCPGVYEVKYRLGENEESVSVNVVDTVSPKLVVCEEYVCVEYDVLTPEQLVLSCYDVTGATVSISENSSEYSAPGTYRITVVAIDAYQNKTEAAVNLLVEPFDSVPPVFYEIADLSITEGDTVDLMEGVNASDNLDDSPIITIDEAEFDANVPGVYTVKYTAEDYYGNITIADRQITVSARPVVTPEPVPVATVETASVTDTVQTESVSGNGFTFVFDTTGVEGQPYLVAVNRPMCTVTVYGKDQAGNYTVPVTAFRCSVGRSGHETPTGYYYTSSRYDWCYMVDDTWGRYAIRINGGIMFHSVCYYTKSMDDLEYDEFNKLGSPASLGCVRLDIADIYWLYTNCPTGFPTVIYDDPNCAGPLGKPDQILIDTSDVNSRGWDPTDPMKP